MNAKSELLCLYPFEFVISAQVCKSILHSKNINIGLTSGLKIGFLRILHYRLTMMPDVYANLCSGITAKRKRKERKRPRSCSTRKEIEMMADDACPNGAVTMIESSGAMERRFF